jgi:ATP-dependent RNA helicase DeaD
MAKETDIIGLAQTGTGKTAAFGLPVIQQIDLSLNKPQALVLCPTRELCMQISGDLKDYSKYFGGVRVLPVYGGSSIETQIKALKSGVHIIVATPGRLIDLIERNVVKMENITKVILDEADEMLNMGFLDSIDNILQYVPQPRNTLLFSATMPPEIASIARKYMNKPIEVTVGAKNSGAENINHVCYAVHAKDKYLTLKRLADYYPDIYGIVFCGTRRETQEVADKLIADGYNAEALHGDLSQTQRDFVMHKFRIKNLQLLVATDVAARGLDVDDLTHIINYNLQKDVDIYTHRSGRTGRAGKKGMSIVITNLKEKFIIRNIEKKIGKRFEWAQVPSGKQVCEKQLYHLINRLESVEIEHDDIEPFLPKVYRKLEWLDKEELIKRLVSVEFNRFLQYYRDSRDLNQVADDSHQRSDRRLDSDRRQDPDRRQDSYSRPGDAPRNGYTRMFLNMGKIDGAYPNIIIDLLKKKSKNKKVDLGRIDIKKKHTIFEIESAVVPGLLKSFQGMIMDNRKLVLKIDEDFQPEHQQVKKNKKRN